MNFHSTVIFVKDIVVSKNFYTGYLGFSIENDFGKNVLLKNGLSLWEVSKEHIIDKELVIQSPSNRFELYFEDNNIETVLKKLKKAGIAFLHELHEEPWGQRTIRFFDPDFHLIEIGEPLDVFVNNMNNSGMTPAQISKKSGIPVAKVISLLGK